MFKYRFSSFLLAAALLLSLRLSASAQAVQGRIVEDIDESDLQPLVKNTHRLARSEFDQGAASADLALDRMLLVLTRSPERQAAFDALLKAQQDKRSPQFHRWLTPQQVGERFGSADTDIAKVTSWLESHGFQVSRVSNAKSTIEFSGTAAQVREAFHTEMHNYLVHGVEHLANASDPQIPAALTPVVAGVATLHNFRKSSQIAAIKPNVVRASAFGSKPKFTASDGENALAPADFATIYNLTPAYGASINGTGSTIAVVARTNINLQDLTDFKNAFGVPNQLPQIVLNGKDPGDLKGGDEAEAVLDASWSAALAPRATVKLVVSASTMSTDGVDLSEQYIVDNNLADVMTESYGDCEANYTQAEAQFYSALAQQAAAEGISYTVASGDSGAEGCDDPASVTTASGAISVNILASTPYNIAVGGTQFNENGNPGYWINSNNSNFSSAVSYIPEIAWNESCTAAQCGSNAGIWAGGGGASILFAKPSWQASVAGIPNDGARDVPDISFSSAQHDFYLLCLDGSCTTKLGQSSFSGVSGTSAATPSFAAIMALVVQYTGSRQGQAAPNLYALAANQNLAACNAALPAASCIFNDVRVGNNAVPGETGYGTSTAAYQAGVGYDLATGLGSVNVYNLITGWSGAAAVNPQVRVAIDSPSPQNSSLIGTTTFSGWALSDASGVTSVNLSIDSVPYGTAAYGLVRPDVCAQYSSSNCPNVGWSLPVDTTLLAGGSHALDVTVMTSTGEVFTASSNFTVANWTSVDPMHIGIDNPSSGSAPFSGVAHFGGWAFDNLAAITQVAVSVDGVSQGLAYYGGDRSDVCSVYSGKAGCPNIGWNALVNTSVLSEGAHTLSITPLTAGGQYSTATATFNVANFASNPLHIVIDSPAAQSGALSGPTNFGGWAIATTTPITSIAVSIDGISFGAASYGGNRSDVCSAHPGTPSCPSVGWNFSLDTAQLLSGLHILKITALTGTGQYATATRLFTTANQMAGSFDLIAIDQPSPQNSILVGQTVFSGWATPVSSNQIDIAIDGAPYGVAAYGLSRPDVCSVFPGDPSCPNVGWSLFIDTTQLANGPHTLTVTEQTPTTLAPTAQKALSSQFTVANWTTANPMKLAIDTPSTQSGPLSGGVGIGGWAIDVLAPISNVTVTIDGLLFGAASYGGARADVCSAYPSVSGCPNVGWNYYLNTTSLSDGSHTLAITGTTAGGQSSTTSTTFEIDNGPATRLRVSIDTPSNSQTLTQISAIGGWALDQNGAPIVSVQVLVDGVFVGTAAYGGTRADVCAHYTTAGGCPNVGWNYELDTTGFANGNHQLDIRAIATDGRQYTSSQGFSIANQP